jgi:molecular chaperone GrpE
MNNDTDKTKKQEKFEHENEYVDNHGEHGEHGEHGGHVCRCGDEKRELRARIEDLDSSYKRALADYQNLQKRASEERQEWVRSANKDLLLRLLPILDTLNLAQKHIQNDGLKVSIAQFLDTLKTEGVTKIEAVGKDFDPHLMECITTEEGKENKVLEEMREGYMLYDKVLRAAQVKVGRK